MERPTLRQVTGFVMIVNTFLPAVVVLALGLMVWSTVTTIKENGCETIGRAEEAFMNIDERPELVQARYGSEFVIDNIGKLVGAVSADPSSENSSSEDPSPKNRLEDATSCTLKKEIRRIIAEEIFGKATTGIEEQMTAIGRNIDGLKKAVSSAISLKIELPAIPKPPRFPPDDPTYEIRKAAVVVARGLGDAVNKGIGEPAAKAIEGVRIGVTNTVYGLFHPEKYYIYLELKKADYKRQVAWELTEEFYVKTKALFWKFFWFFLVLAVWLTFSYILWAHRRLSVAWALLRNQEPI